MNEIEEKIKSIEEIKDLKIREEKYKEYLDDKTRLIKLRESLLNNEERENRIIEYKMNKFEKKLKKDFDYLEKSNTD